MKLCELYCESLLWFFQLSQKLADVPVESVIEVRGTVELRPDGKMNPVGYVGYLMSRSINF